METSPETEVQRQAESKKRQYIEPISGFSADDVVTHLESLHDMFLVFMSTAVAEAFTKDYADDVTYTYQELRTFLKRIAENGKKFDELRAAKKQAA